MKLRNLGMALTAISAAVFGVVGTANNAFAGSESADVNFSLNVPHYCVFSDVVNGRLGKRDPNNDKDYTSYVHGQGSATVSCLGSATITVSPPEQVGADNIEKIIVKKGTLLYTSDGLIAQSAVPTQLDYYGLGLQRSHPIDRPTKYTQIEISILTKDPIPPGNYQFKTTLTATY